MNKQELIDSFPKEGSTLSTWIMAVISLAIIVSLAFGLYQYIIKKDISIQGVVSVFMVITVFGGFLVTYSHNVYKANIKDNQLQWRRDAFYLKYLPTVIEEKIQIKDHTINSDGTINITLKTKHPQKTIKFVSNIKYFVPNQTDKTAYVLVRWVEGLNEVGIEDDFYAETAYLPRQEKSLSNPK